jgi:hypothetical protein
MNKKYQIYNSELYEEGINIKWVKIRWQNQQEVKKYTRYLKTEDIDKEVEKELLLALDGKSEKYTKYQAARMVVALGLNKGLIIG